MSINEVLKKLKAEVEAEFLNNIQPYWYSNSMDDVNGGFFGRVNHDNIPITEAEKGGILNARILWTFSAAFKQYPSSISKELAHRAYHYLTGFLIDKEYGGVFWTVNHNGIISDDRKHVYVQAFAIYGLVEFYSAFGDEAALNQALELYELIEKYCSDETFGGYFEAYSHDWKLIDDVRLSDKDKNVPKSMNTHLHILEAYTNLYRHHPSEQIGHSLGELLNIFEKYIFNEGNYSLVCFFDENWERKSSVISLGHDIEASWLCLEAAEVLGLAHWVNVFKTTALKVSRNVIQGTDLDGGLINELTAEKVIDSNKDWWPQAEALVGHLNAFQISGQVEFLKAAVKSWDFIKAFIIDNENGEWFEKVNREGKPFKNLDKIRLWKAPYHNGRAIFEVSRRVEEIIKKSITDSTHVKVEKSS